MTHLRRTRRTCKYAFFEQFNPGGWVCSQVAQFPLACWYFKRNSTYKFCFSWNGTLCCAVQGEGMSLTDHMVTTADHSVNCIVPIFFPSNGGEVEIAIHFAVKTICSAC